MPTRDYRFFVRDMNQHWMDRSSWFGRVTSGDLRKVLTRIRRNGALTIRDIDDDVLVEKTHEWASRKPSKRALQLAFYRGIAHRQRAQGDAEDLRARRAGTSAGTRRRGAAPEREILEYLLDRALRAQGIVSVDSICHLDAGARRRCAS